MSIDSKKQQNFKQLLWESGFTDTSYKGQERIAAYFDRTPRTIRRWLKENKAPSLAIAKLNRETQVFNKHWDNFLIVKNEIVTPNGYRYTARELETLGIQIEMMRNNKDVSSHS